jgi:hypothetical protein
MDNWLASFEEEQKTIDIVRELIETLKKAEIELRKFYSN